MRELKFRVWNGMKMEYDVMVGKFGTFYVNPMDGQGLDPNDSASLTSCNTKYPENIPVMQCTGLKDKSGKDIYEGDKFKYTTHSRSTMIDFIGSVAWDNQGSCWGYYSNHQSGNLKAFCSWDEIEYDLLPHIEVVGNIYEKL
jgi:uncharacterized phage protein (TIGR01671 family)